MLSKRSKILDLNEQGLIAPDDIQRAMGVAGVFPNRQRWYHFIEIFLLWLGVMALTAGIVLFVAYNWDHMGRMSKFALIEGLLIVSLLPLLKFDSDTIIGKIFVFGAGIILGALLALFGQIYQTGADTWQLFATWAAMLLPMAWIARFEPLWIMWITIVNVAVMLYFSLFDFFFFSSSLFMSLVLISVNTLFLAAWEYLQNQNHARTYVRFPAVFSVASATLLGLDSIVDFRGSNEIWLIVWLLWIIAYCWIYRRKIQDLFMLALGCLCAIIVVVTFLSRHVIGNGFEGRSLFLIAISIIVAGSLSGMWLKNTAHQWETEDES